MDFISRHYEKMVLAVCLLFLVFSLVMVQKGNETTHQRLAADLKKSERTINDGNLIDVFTEKDFQKTKQRINDQRLKFNFIGDGRRPGSLIAPADYIVCKNHACRSIMLLRKDVENLFCPFCGMEQPKMANAIDGREDSDGDGIPDEVEKKYKFLDYRNPEDGNQDYDRDGFLNVEEFEAGTEMDNSLSIPSLSKLLRVGNVLNNDFRIQLRDIDKNGSENKNDWTISIRIPNPRNPRGYPNPKQSLNRSTSVGATVRLSSNVKEPAYIITDAGFEQVGDEIKPFIVVQSNKDNTEVYRLGQEQLLKEKQYVVRFVFLYDRRASSARTVMERSFDVRVGEQFELKKRLFSDDVNVKVSNKDSIVQEFFRLEKADLDGNDIVVVKLDGDRVEPTEKNVRSVIPEIDPTHDFYTPKQTTPLVIDIESIKSK